MIPSKLLEGKKVLLGVSASISLYKSLELIRLLTKAGAEVRVVMSEASKRFVSPLSFETLSGHAVLDQHNENWHSDHNHIGIAKWADAFIIAPATANTINKLANGIADNLLTQTALAYEKEKLIAPAANTAMIQSPLTQASLKLLKLAHYTLIDTQSKELACKTEGDGALAEPIELFYQVARLLLKESFWEYRRVIVTGGGTIEPIDSVRFLSNHSSGKMASALALALYFKGADVCFISSKFPTTLPQALCRIEVQTAQEMQEYLIDSIRIAKKGLLSKASLIGQSQPQLIQKEPFLFMAAAVSDYKASFAQEGKLKKAQLGSKWSLELEENIDILANLDKSGIKSIGFKAELDAQNALDAAQKMLEEKNLDGVALNILQNSQSFGSSNNAFTFLSQEKRFELSKKDKLSLALELLGLCQNL